MKKSGKATGGQSKAKQSYANVTCSMENGTENGKRALPTKRGY